MATVILFANRRDLTNVFLGTAAGFVTALLFWVIALREARHPGSEGELPGT